MLKYSLIISFLSIFYSAGAQIGFTNVTDESGLTESIPGDTHGSGVSAADFDGDGDVDLYLCTEEGQYDQLYRNDGAQFSQLDAESIGITSLLRSRMALWIDINSDAQLDLIVSGDCDYGETDCQDTNYLRMYLQNEGTFTDISETAVLYGFGPVRNNQTLGGMAAADINLDGKMDFVQAIRNGRLEVFINQGDNTFSESGLEFGFDTTEYKYYQPMFYDFDHNGLIDLYCNVDFDENQMWLQESPGTFVNRAKGTKTNSRFNEMGMALGDHDRDGDIDIYSTNIANYLGQNAHNLLLKNNLSLTGYLAFSEEASDLGVGQGGWGWGATLFDANNDGWLDIATTNGWDLPFEVIDTSKFWVRQPYSRFHDISDSVGFNDNENATTLISFDWDLDGYLDMAQTIKGFTDARQALRLFRNEPDTSVDGNYLVIKPRMTGKNVFAIGATVKVHTEEAILLRPIHAGTSFYGQEPAEAHFGLKDAQAVSKVEIVWPGGAVSSWDNIDANQVITLMDTGVIHTPSYFTAVAMVSAVELTWNDLSTNESGFVLERSTMPQFNEVMQFELEANTKSFVDSLVNPGVSYYYRLKAVSENKVSLYTETADAVPIVLGTPILKDTGITIFPNPVPANSSVTIMHGRAIDQISLYTLSGRLVENLKTESHTNQTTVDLSSIDAGIYILRINGAAYKLIVE